MVCQVLGFAKLARKECVCLRGWRRLGATCAALMGIVIAAIGIIVIAVSLITFTDYHSCIRTSMASFRIALGFFSPRKSDTPDLMICQFL